MVCGPDLMTHLVLKLGMEVFGLGVVILGSSS